MRLPFNGVIELHGALIAEAISRIPQDEIRESLEKGYPTALVIVAQPYRDQVVQYLEGAGMS